MHLLNNFLSSNNHPLVSKDVYHDQIPPIHPAAQVKDQAAHLLPQVFWSQAVEVHHGQLPHPVLSAAQVDDKHQAHILPHVLHVYTMASHLTLSFQLPSQASQLPKTLSNTSISGTSFNKIQLPRRMSSISTSHLTTTGPRATQPLRPPCPP